MRNSSLNTDVNWSHVGLLVSGIFAVGVAYGNMNSKIDKLLAYQAKYEATEIRISHLEAQDQANTIFHKTYDERFLKDENDIKANIEQRPPKHNFNN